jgi:hypothetical protein
MPFARAKSGRDDFDLQAGMQLLSVADESIQGKAFNFTP